MSLAESIDIDIGDNICLLGCANQQDKDFYAALKQFQFPTLLITWMTLSRYQPETVSTTKPLPLYVY